MWSPLCYDYNRDRDKCGPPYIVIVIQLVRDKSGFYIIMIIQLDLSIVLLEENFFHLYMVVPNFEKIIFYFAV